MLSFGFSVRKYQAFLKIIWDALNKGDYVRVKIHEPYPEKTRVTEGYVIAKYPTYIVLKGQKYRECYHVNSFFCGDTEIIEHIKRR